ncbi:MAG: DNA-directed RNA polymerase subunit alpha [Clostridia bacterium]|nr:DNA-directed RNA polymerase subunit alpha [Clostridia bacterium]
MRELVKPKEIIIEKDTFSDTYGRFVIEPLERGYGITVGNSLRRILLSSIPGVAVISVKIEGVFHEFCSIKGVKEDVLQIIQNFKKIRARLFTGEKEKKIFLDVRGPLEVKASHIKPDSEAEIVNPDVPIATLDNKNTHLSMEITLAKGMGYVEAEENKKADQPVGTIPIDSVFTPIKKVKYEVRSARIGRKTSFDSLALEVFTDGTVRPDEVIQKAAKILIECFAPFATLGKKEIETKMEKREFLEEEVEKIGFSATPLRALKGLGIKKMRDLTNVSGKELLKIQKFGKKSLEKVERELAKYNLSLAKEKENET